MKVKRIEETFIFKGFGFPVELSNVPVVEVYGGEAPLIKLEQLEECVLREIVKDSTLILTGHHLKFIRQTLNLSLRDMASSLMLCRETVRRIESKRIDEELTESLTTLDIERLKFLIVEFLNKKNTDCYFKGIQDEDKERDKTIIKVA